MMKLFLNAASFVSMAMILTGCQFGYKDVALEEVQTVITEHGQTVTITEAGYVAYREIIERSPNVKAVTRMTDMPAGRKLSKFSVSPNGETLVYQASETKKGVKCMNLWMIPTTGGTGMTRLTTGRYIDSDPAFDPTGKSVYFASNRISRVPKLWRIRTNGAGGITRITQGDFPDRAPSISLGADQVYYASKPENAEDWQLWRVESNGSLPTQLREGSRPMVSPDGKRMLYTWTDTDTDKRQIWMMDVDGTNQTQMSAGRRFEEIEASWSHDGKRIAFSTDSAKDSNGVRNSDIWMMDSDGSNLTQLTTNGSTDRKPQFSADGKFIYFLSNRGFDWNIWRMEIADADAAAEPDVKVDTGTDVEVDVKLSESDSESETATDVGAAAADEGKLSKAE